MLASMAECEQLRTLLRAKIGKVFVTSKFSSIKTTHRAVTAGWVEWRVSLGINLTAAQCCLSHSTDMRPRRIRDGRTRRRRPADVRVRRTTSWGHSSQSQRMSYTVCKSIASCPCRHRCDHIVTLPPLGYFDIAFGLYVWRYKGTKFLSNILIFIIIYYWLSVNYT